MLEHKKSKSLIALLGAMALIMGAPLAASAAAPTSATVASAASTAASAVSEAAAPAEAAPAEEEKKAEGHDLTFYGMFMQATVVVKIVMVALVVAAFWSWILLVVKLMEFGGLNAKTSEFLEAFRGARSIADINRIATSDQFAGNPMADMAAVATEEITVSKGAGLSISGEHKENVLHRAAASVNAVQAGLSRRLNGGQTFLASVGSSGPFIGLFGTVYGIMNSFIGIANTNTTNLAVVAPGIAEALMATGIGLIAAIPAVIMFNIFNNMISAYGTRSEQFVSELMNSMSRQLDKGA
jgi:biopolymer transport protein ExbB